MQNANHIFYREFYPTPALVYRLVKPGLTTRKVWLVQPGLHAGKPWFNKAFGARGNWRITYRIGFHNRGSGRLALACFRRLESGMRREVKERGKK